MQFIRYFMLVAGCFFLAPLATAQTVTLESLLSEMIDREAIARFPEIPIQVKQFSSYDRKSVAPGQPEWFANADRTQFIRKETTDNGSEWVLFDDQGPGAIVRFWMTFAGEDAGKGTLRIYIDGREKPVAEGSAFDLLSGHQLVGPPLSTSVSERTPYHQRGHNLYLPIPYAKACKITYQSDGIPEDDQGAQKRGSEAVYYNINYREYPEQVQVESFSEEVLSRAKEAILSTQVVLSAPYENVFEDKAQGNKKKQKLPPGEALSLDFSGSQYIKALSMSLDAEYLPQALRSTILELSFDGTTTLRCPVGDFFGTGYQINPYQTWYTKVYQDGLMLSLWPMPFQQSAVVKVRNLGDQPVEIQGLRVVLDDWEWDDRSMYFGGSWKQFYQEKTGGPDNPVDLNFNTLEGKGVYVGDVVTLYNAAGAWWGEGDEKIYVDGESFPSHFGTGSEDYYGYAWSRPERFDHPFMAQPDGSGNLSEGTAVNLRFRALDAIPFNSRLQMDMELWHWTETVVNYAPTTLFYLRPNGKSLTVFSEEQTRKKVAFERKELIEPKMVDGSIEGEHMEVILIDDGEASPQLYKDWGWQNDQQMWWRQAKVGDTLQLGFTSDKAYQNQSVDLMLTTASDYGQVSISLNDSPVVQFDGYAPQGGIKQVKLSDVDIQKGSNTLQVEITGKNKEASPGHMFGIDYLSINKSD